MTKNNELDMMTSDGVCILTGEFKRCNGNCNLCNIYIDTIIDIKKRRASGEKIWY